tara:strand:- start:173 stop:427 length:255 start_codon:yes stop_codon:yes gene_type:complete
MKTNTTKTKAGSNRCFRIFNDYTINFLARTLNYKPSYLMKVMAHPEELTDRFVHNAIGFLDRTEDDLFSLVERAEEKADDNNNY